MRRPARRARHRTTSARFWFPQRNSRSKLSGKPSAHGASNLRKYRYRISECQRVGWSARRARPTSSAERSTSASTSPRVGSASRAALDDTVAYVTDREQFGQHIGDFQGIRWRIAEMATRVDTARLLTLRAATVADRGEDAAREMSMAKIHATEAAVKNTNEALQLHGGIGYTTEHDIERYLRDARLLTIAGGPNELHRNTLADAVLGE
ncbi:MAG TPA: acyl-CoA dehydrogenase family protein [Halococcus sp.]|nr:acyl-CoA dehydrogenase family protein [Halococcus sp.]